MATRQVNCIMMDSNKNNLTIMITTFNRRQRLLNMLHSIERQGHWGEYKLLIVDNCSPDYNWEEMLSEFQDEFRNNIEINIRSFNCGMSCNISSCFLLIKTRWVLYLSDDDEILDGGLDIVLKDIEKYNYAGAIKYTISHTPEHKDIEIKNIENYIDYFTNYPFPGDVIFLTMAYNIDILKNYLTYITAYAYSYVSFNLPIIAGLIDKNIVFKLSSNSILKYIPAEKGKQWDYTNILLGISTFLDIPLNNILIQQKIALLKIIMANFHPNLTLRNLIKKKCPKKYKDYLFNKFYYSLYKPIYGYKSLMFYVVYKLYRLFHINMFAIHDTIENKR